MEFQYTIDPNSESPIMLIEGSIGLDEYGNGVDGGKFCRELLFLDTLNKKSIQLWINSGGGSVFDSDLIVSSILKSHTPVDTHNVGMCASCAGAIFLAGRNRYMMDYAKFMIHGVSGASRAAYTAFTDGIRTNLTSRCKLTEDEARRMMSSEVWLSADECETYGIAKKEPSGTFNKPRKSSEPANYKDYSAIVNSMIATKKPTKQMDKVTNKLQLNPSANEDAICSAIEAIQNKHSEATAKLAAQEAENKAKVDALNKQISDLTEAKNKFEAEQKVAAEAKLKADAEALKAKAKADITAAVGLGKIENKAEIIEAWEANYIASPENTVKLIEKMAVNKSAPKPIVGAKPTGASNTADLSVDNTNPQAYATARNIQNLQKAQNRYQG